MNKTLTAFIIAGVAGVASSPASAAPDRVAIAKAIATERWGAVCAGQPISIVRGLPAGDPATARSYYSFDGSQPDNGALYHNCSIHFRGGAISWPVFCTAVVHEYGHLAGWRPVIGQQFPGDRFHSGNINSVMYPHYVRPWAKC